MKLVLFVLVLVLLPVLSCTSKVPSTRDVWKLARGGEKNLPKLYEIAATTEGYDLEGTCLNAIGAIGAMGHSGTPFLIDLLTIPGSSGRRNAAFSQLCQQISNYKEHRSFLALFYSIHCSSPEWQKAKLFDFRLHLLDVKGIKGIDENSSMSEICLWWLRESEKFSDQILPKQWTKPVVLATLLDEIEKHPDCAKENKDILDRTRAEIRALEQTKEPDGTR